MNTNTALIVAVVLFNGMIAGCQPKTPVEKAKDKIEDATHETGQAIERAGNRVKDLAN